MKLIAFDLDGTTITEGDKLSDRNRIALEKAQEQGVILVPSTGRMLTFIPDNILNFPGVRYLITSNGAGVYDKEKGEYIEEILLTNEKAQEVQSVLDKYNLYIEYYMKGKAATKRGNPEKARDVFQFPEDTLPFTNKDYSFFDDYMSFLIESKCTPEKINMSYVYKEVYDEVLKSVEELGDLYVTSSRPYNMEICSSKANKGEGLKRLSSRLGIELSEVMAVGDNENDVSMLKLAGFSVAVDNAKQITKDAAKYQTARYDDDGLGKAIEKYVLS